jgi:hypothetical protein
MKKRFYIKLAVVSLAAMASLSSCLKDSTHYTDFGAVAPLVELPLAEIGDQAGAGGEYQAPTYDLAKASTDTLQIYVNLASPEPLKSNLTVNLSLTNTTALTAFNNANGTSFTALPAADYTVIGATGLNPVIDGGARLAYIRVVINAALIGDGNDNFVLPVTITGDSQSIQIAQPEKVLLYNINVEDSNDDDGLVKSAAKKIGAKRIQ